MPLCTMWFAIIESSIHGSSWKLYQHMNWSLKAKYSVDMVLLKYKYLLSVTLVFRLWEWAPPPPSPSLCENWQDWTPFFSSPYFGMPHFLFACFHFDAYGNLYIASSNLQEEQFPANMTMTIYGVNFSDDAASMIISKYITPVRHSLRYNDSQQKCVLLGDILMCFVRAALWLHVYKATLLVTMTCFATCHLE